MLYKPTVSVSDNGNAQLRFNVKLGHPAFSSVAAGAASGRVSELDAKLLVLGVVLPDSPGIYQADLGH